MSVFLQLAASKIRAPGFAIRLASYSSSSSSRFDNEDYSISDTESDSSSSDETSIKNVKEEILKASLDFVNQHGWTSKSLALGAEKVNFSKMSHGLFASGGYELLSHFYKTCNKELEDELKGALSSSPSKISTRNFVEDAVKFRLKLIVPYISRWPEAMVLMTQPQNVRDAFKNLTAMIDDVWYHAGDKSVDSSWYTKRLALGLVYKTTELSLINDRSEDFEETWKFLGRRLNDLDALKSYSSQFSEMKPFLSSSFEVARNLLSLNNFNRK